MNATINHNGKVIHHNNSFYKIIVAALGKMVLVDAECVDGPDKGTILNLKKSRTPLAAVLRQRINLNLVS